MIGYIKENEKKSKIKNSLIHVQGKKSTLEPIQYVSLSNKLNIYCGRIIFPSVFLIFSLGYTLLVVIHKDEQENFQKLEC